MGFGLYPELITGRGPYRVLAMMRFYFPGFFLVALLLLEPGFAAAAEDVAGTVTRLRGSAVAMQDAVPRVLKVGDKVQRGDVISTGSGARLEMTMLDDAVMTLGEKTMFVVIDYIAVGAEPYAAMRLLQGAFRATSGKMMEV